MHTDDNAASQEVSLERMPAEEGEGQAKKNSVLALPIQVMVSVGKAKMTVEELMAIDPEAIIELDSAVDDPVEILVGDRVIARGDLVEIEQAGLGVKVTALVEQK
ncbi:MAG: FliM/FliN family flagellar motor switch protein [Pseudomonadota bacterium]